jgi:hypothetical protein
LDGAGGDRHEIHRRLQRPDLHRRTRL